MSRTARRFLVLAGPLLVLAACAVANRLTLTGELFPPPAARTPADAPQAVVLDFAYGGGETAVIGRDFDNVRPIEWTGEPGKAMADRVASILAESGVTVVRASAESPPPDGAAIRISGNVQRFEVNVRRRSVVKIRNEASVSLSVTASGGTLSTPISFGSASSHSMEDVFVTPEGARDVLSSAADAAAGEAARRILEAGVIVPPPPGK